MSSELDDIASLFGSEETPQETVVAPVTETPTEPVVAEPVVSETQETPAIAEAEVVEATPEVTLVETPAVDPFAHLAEMYGDKIKSKEDLDRIISQYEESQEKLKQGTYKTEMARKLDEWLDAGLGQDLFFQTQSLNVDSMDDLGVLKALHKIKTPHRSEEQIEKLIMAKYQQTDDFSDSNQEVGKMLMEDDAMVAKQELLKYKNMTLVEDAKAAKEQGAISAAQAETQRVETWNKELPNLVIDKLTVATSDKEQFDFVLNASQKAALAQHMAAVIQQASNVAYTPESVNNVTQAMKREAFAMFGPEITKAVAAKTQSNLEEKYRVELQNPSGLKAGSPTSPTNTTKSKDDSFFAAIMEAEG